MILDNGIHAGIARRHADRADESVAHMYYATTGLNARQVMINGSQKISRQEVLKLYTSNSGWFLREEDQLGAIEPGRLADLAVLSDDYFTVPDESLKKIRSVMTVVNGNIVHNAGVL
jgi:predicted amidohydrolase YtcJ